MPTSHIDFQALFQTLPANCAVLDENLCFVAVNDLYLQTLDSSAGFLIGKSVLDAFPETPERQTLIETSFRKALAGEPNTLNEIAYRIPAPDEESGTKEIWWNVHSSPLADAEGTIAFFVIRVEDVTSDVQTRLLKDAIAGELQHRVGNLLTLVSTIANRTADHSTDLEEFKTNFQARIISLARTHSMLTGGDWNGMTMSRLVTEQLSEYTDKPVTKISIDGPELKLSPAEAQSISMGLHELATNAAKYGSLGDKAGKLSVTWQIAKKNGYTFEWREEGLKDIQAPQKLGFGSMILTRILPSQLNGKADREFSSTSHVYRLTVDERLGTD